MWKCKETRIAKKQDKKQNKTKTTLKRKKNSGRATLHDFSIEYKIQYSRQYGNTIKTDMPINGTEQIQK